MTTLIPTIDPQKIAAAEKYLAALDQKNQKRLKNRFMNEASYRDAQTNNRAWMESCQYDIPYYERWIPVSVYYNAVNKGLVPPRSSVAMTGTIPTEDWKAISAASQSPKSTTSSDSLANMSRNQAIVPQHSITILNDSSLAKKDFVLKLFDEIRWFGI
jgi:hypothetical protein